MSSYDAASQKAETQQGQQKGNEALLTPEERAQLRRLLGQPSDYPRELGPWIREYLAINPVDTTIAQLTGQKGVPRYLFRSATQTSVVNTASETDVFSEVVKGKTIAPTGQLKVKHYYKAKSPDASNFCTIWCKLGAGSLQHEIFTTELDGTFRIGWFEALILGAGSYQSQIMSIDGLQMSQTGTPARPGQGNLTTVDLSQDQKLSVSYDWGSGNADSEVVSLYTAVEVFNPVGA